MNDVMQEELEKVKVELNDIVIKKGTEEEVLESILKISNQIDKIILKVHENQLACSK